VHIYTLEIKKTLNLYKNALDSIQWVNLRTMIRVIIMY